MVMPWEENNSSRAIGSTVIFKLLIGFGPCPILQRRNVLKTFRVYHQTRRECGPKANDLWTHD